MIRTILVYCDGSTRDAQRCQQASLLASQSAAHVTALLVTPIPDIVVLTEPTLEAMAVERIRADIVAAGDHAEARLNEWFRGTTATADVRRLQLPERSTASAVAALARTADLFVANLPYARGGDGVAMTERVLFSSGRACLLLPPSLERSPPYRTVVVGWDDSRVAARAVAAAMPLLQAASSVHVIMVGRERPDIGHSAVRLTHHLNRCGVRAEFGAVAATGATGPALIGTAQDLGADLLVVGAYGHARLGELVVGGATRHLLQHAPISVFTAH